MYQLKVSQGKKYGYVSWRGPTLIHTPFYVKNDTSGMGLSWHVMAWAVNGLQGHGRACKFR